MGSREALAQNNCQLSFPPEHAHAKNSAKVPVRPPTRSVQLAGWYPRSTRCPRGLPRACPLSPGRAVGSGCRPRGVRPAVCRAGLLARGSTGSSSASSRPCLPTAPRCIVVCGVAEMVLGCWRVRGWPLLGCILPPVRVGSGFLVLCCSGVFLSLLSLRPFPPGSERCSYPRVPGYSPSLFV